MHSSPSTPIRLMLAMALAASVFTAGCGGGGAPADETSADAAEATDATAAKLTRPVAARTQPVVAKPPAYTVVATELVTNGLFVNGLANWAVQDVALAASQLRPGGSAMNVGYQAIQSFSGTALEAGKSYTLTVNARNEKSKGSTQLAVSFQRAGSSEKYRTYTTAVTTNAYQIYTVSFTAPAYTAVPKLTITASGTRTIIDSVSLQMRSAIVQTEAVASTTGSFVPAGYALAFNDEFNGSTLNRSKWFTRMIYGGGTTDYLNDEQQRYRDNDNQVVADGVLSLVARKVNNNADGINYESGMIRSDWTARYGYFEARVKMPGGLGVWPAFWLNSDVSSSGVLSWPPEIDIFEFVNNGVEDTVNMLHSNVSLTSGATSPILFADPAFDTTWTYYRAPFNFNDGWHTIGASWDASNVTMYIDGKKIYTRGYAWNYANGSAAGPAHIILNFAVGGSWAGRHGIDDSAFPQSLQIDWVRAYKKLN